MESSFGHGRSSANSRISFAVQAGNRETLLRPRWNVTFARRQRYGWSQTLLTASVEAHNAYASGPLSVSCAEIWMTIARRLGSSIRRFGSTPITPWPMRGGHEAWTFIGDLAIGEKGTLGLRRNMMPRGRRGRPESRRGTRSFGLGQVRFSEWKFSEGLAELRRANELLLQQIRPQPIYLRAYWRISWSDSTSRS